MRRTRRAAVVSVLLAMSFLFIYQSSSRLFAAPSMAIAQARAWVAKAIEPASRLSIVQKVKLPVRLAQSSGGGSSSPTVQTDKPDYSPGQTVIVTGSGWATNTQVTLTFHEMLAQPNHVDVVKITFADANGTIDTSRPNNNDDDFELEDHDIGLTYLLAATGLTSSGASGSAQTTFTDAIPHDFKQCANEDTTLGDCHWINSILQKQDSRIFEGMSTLQRVVLTEIPTSINNNIYRAQFKMDGLKGGAHAYDFVTTWDAAIAATNAVAPPGITQSVPLYPSIAPGDLRLRNATANSLACGAEIPTTGNTPSIQQVCLDLRDSSNLNVYLVPLTGSVADINGDSVQARLVDYQNRYQGGSAAALRIYSNQPLDNILFVFAGYDAQDNSHWSLTYHKAATATGDPTQLLIEFAAHVGVGVDPLVNGSNGDVGYGIGKGAASISGAPFHVSLDNFDNGLDDNNAGDDGMSGSEDNQLSTDVLVPPSTPSVVTEVRNAADEDITGKTVPPETTVHDWAQVDSESVVQVIPDNSTFTFHRFNNGTCSGTPAVNQTDVDISPTGQRTGTGISSDFTPTVPGDYSYLVDFVSGDTLHVLNHTGDAATECEPFTVGKKDLNISTTVHSDSPDQALEGNLDLGAGAHDSATVTGKVGTLTLPDVTFYFFGKDVPCTNGSTTGGTALTPAVSPDSNGVAHPSTSQTALAAGSYNFMAVVASNANYNGKTGDCEPFTVGKKDLNISTTVHSDSPDQALSGDLTLGGGAHDSATVTGKVASFTLPNVTFYFFDKGVACTNGSTTGGTALTPAVSPDSSGVAHPSTSKTGLAAGSYNFMAVVASNDNYNGKTGDCEPFTVGKVQLRIATVLHKADESPVTTSVPLGSIIHDRANVSGLVMGFDRPDVTFYFFRKGVACTNGSTTGAIALNTVGTLGSGIAHPSTALGPLQAGTYTFMAVVASNDNYTGATSDCEPFTVNKAPTTTVTQLHNGPADDSFTTPLVLANYGNAATGTVHDRAATTGQVGSIAITGDVSFHFYTTQAACVADTTFGSGVDKGTVALVAGVAHASTVATGLTAGNYAFRAKYNGDGNYNTSLSDCEPFYVSTITVIKNAKPAQGSFEFTTSGTGYNGFTLTGATANNGNKNAQILQVGTYTAHESTQLGWLLTGIGGAGEPNPYNCTADGVGGSDGVGDLATQTVTIHLKAGDAVTCVFENTGQGVTRTQGFWATHTKLAEPAWFGGTSATYPTHTFPGVDDVPGVGQGDFTLCSTISGYNGTTVGKNINTLAKLMGGFWSDISKTTTNKKRSALDQARMQLLQQLLAAELNASAFGAVPSSGSIAAWETAYCTGNNIQTALQQAASFNNSGDSGTFTPGTSADSKNARAVADKAFWDPLP
jgi:hypothetical protein